MADHTTPAVEEEDITTLAANLERRRMEAMREAAQYIPEIDRERAQLEALHEAGHEARHREQEGLQALTVVAGLIAGGLPGLDVADIVVQDAIAAVFGDVGDARRHLQDLKAQEEVVQARLDVLRLRRSEARNTASNLGNRLYNMNNTLLQDVPPNIQPSDVLGNNN